MLFYFLNIYFFIQKKYLPLTYNKNAAMDFKELKESVAKNLIAIGKRCNGVDKLKITLEVGCSHRTLISYLKGDVRKIELGERIINVGNEYIKNTYGEQIN